MGLESMPQLGQKDQTAERLAYLADQKIKLEAVKQQHLDKGEIEMADEMKRKIESIEAEEAKLKK